MPSIQENYKSWNETYSWHAQGDEWSEPWGSVVNQWYTLLLPRIYHFLPAEHILEIAPGFGRWTQFLLNHAQRLSVVDLSEKCITHCRERFAGHHHIAYYVNDGLSLEGIEDASVDFVFSFDSLVHVELDVISAYLKEIKRVLKPGGYAILHHSNLAAVLGTWNAKVSRRIRKYLSYVGIRFKWKSHHWRGRTVSAARVLEVAQQHGLACTGQEVFKWISTPHKTDCISVFWKGDTQPGQYVKFENAFFQADVEKSVRLMECYGKDQAIKNTGL